MRGGCEGGNRYNKRGLRQRSVGVWKNRRDSAQFPNREDSVCRISRKTGIGLGKRGASISHVIEEQVVSLGSRSAGLKPGRPY